MSKITFDTEDYYDDDTLKDMIECETECYIREYVADMMRERQYWVSNFITMTAKKIVDDTLTAKIPGYKEKIVDKISDIIDGLCWYNIDDNDKLVRVLEDCIEELRPKISKKLDDICMEKLDANYLVDCVTDKFYDMLSDMLMDKKY